MGDQTSAVVARQVAPLSAEERARYVLLPATTGKYAHPALLAAAERSDFDLTHAAAQQALLNRGSFMPALPQFCEVLDSLLSGTAQDGNGRTLGWKRSGEILGEILDVRAPWRAEHLDASFQEIKGTLTVTYHRVMPDGASKKVKESVRGNLMEDRYLNLREWVENPTPQGLPRKGIQTGVIFSYHPRSDSVAWFSAYSDGADLVCYWYPRVSDSALGVREMKVAPQARE